MDSIKFWHSLKAKDNANFDDLTWYNKDIQIGKKTVFSSNLFKSGLWTSRDLFANEQIVSFETWLKRGAKQCDYIFVERTYSYYFKYYNV